MSRRFLPIQFSALLIVALWWGFPAQNSTLAAQGNSCVDCHSRPEVENATAKNYSDWKGSVHEENGVTCEACHRGDPASAAKEVAHQAVFRSGDPRSKVYFKNVPATCGSCHKEEFNQFRKSLHFIRLETSESGPNCVTCHGARATRIVTPPEMANLCTICHNKRLGIRVEMPSLAHSTLMLMNQTKVFVEVIDDYMGKVPAKGKVQDQATRLLQQSRNSLKLAKLRWHTFDLNAIEKSSTRAWDAALSAWLVLTK
jgi:formate-dependent nitrite reductase cytochrome c552 subunit